MAVPCAWPLYPVQIIPGMFGLFLNDSASTIPMVCMTTMVFGFTAATASMSSFWLPGRAREKRSDSSLPVFWSVPTKRRTTSADAAMSRVSLSVAGTSASRYTNTRVLGPVMPRVSVLTESVEDLPKPRSPAPPREGGGITLAVAKILPVAEPSLTSRIPPSPLTDT